MRRFAKTIFLSLVTLLQASAISVWVDAQTFTVIHYFTGGGDGGNPHASLTMDAAGNIYGTTSNGGAGYGTVFKLKHAGSSWILTPLYWFAGGNDGASPGSRVTLAQDGTLYGSTAAGGGSGCNGYGCGTVFHLTPAPRAPKSALTPWTETVLYRFTGGDDGALPQGELTFDQAGDIYGTTVYGGNQGYGVIYELIPSAGAWTETVVYSAQNNGDGANPYGGVVSDASNLYGVFLSNGPHGVGAVYELSPSGSSWQEQTLYGFTGGSDGAYPEGGLITDPSGNLYGTTVGGGTSGAGTVFKMTPSGGGWTLTTLYNFSGSGRCGPVDKLVLDGAGNLYGTTFCDGLYGYGSVFKLTPSNGGWTYASLHDFCPDGYPCTDDGAWPVGSLVFDANGNLYGTVSGGGSNDLGVVFEITSP
jgi:uncharacterized repeat protein (TIGR03803 family)